MRNPTTPILIASNNAHKLQEFREIFSQFGAGDVELLTPKSLGLDLDPEETADTYIGNALIKARAFYSFINTMRDRLPPNLMVMSDDSGLEVDALDGRPGVLSARYHKASPNGDGCAALLREMVIVSDTDRAARFRAIIVMIAPDGAENIFEGVCEGSIGREKRGAGGFGFDPVFKLAGDVRHLAELRAEEKHPISHRGVAGRKVIAFLNSA
jgi:XTP/dITP diphosphohydrolase